MEYLRFIYHALRCGLGLHFWVHGTYRPTGCHARKCRECGFAQEYQSRWVRCYPSSVIPDAESEVRG